MLILASGSGTGFPVIGQFLRGNQRGIAVDGAMFRVTADGVWATVDSVRR